MLSLVRSQGYPNIQDRKYVQDGGTVTFSWNLQTVDLAEFTVRGPSTSSSIFHVTKGFQPTLVNDTYKSRIHNASYMRGTERVFTFQLSGVGMSDGGTYSVYAGSPNTLGVEVDGSQLVVARVLRPYIVSTDTAPHRTIARLTCYFFTVLSDEGSLTTVINWRKNNVPLKYGISSHDGTFYNWEYYHVSTLTIYHVNTSTGDRYSCQATVDKLMVNVLSEEHTLGSTAAMSDYPITTVINETENTNVVWNLPFRDSDFYVSRDSGDLIFHVNQTMIYIIDKYWSRIKISDVSTTSSRSLIVRFTLYNVTSTDAGKLDCRVYDKEWHILLDWHHLLVISRKPEDPRIYSSGSLVPRKPLVLICSTLSLSLPVNHGQRMSYSWRRNKHLLGRTDKYHHEGATLTIATLFNEESFRGRYSCQARELGVNSDWSAEYSVEETYSRSTLIIVIMVSFLTVMLIVAITVVMYHRAYKALKESSYSTPLDTYITPVSDTRTSVANADPNTYETIDVGTGVAEITPIPSLSDVNHSDQHQTSSDNGNTDDSVDATRSAHIGNVDISEPGFTFSDGPHAYYSTSIHHKRPQEDAAGYVGWDKLKGMHIPTGINEHRYEQISDVMDLNELDFTSRTFTALDESSTSQSRDRCITSVNGERLQTNAAGYVQWDDAKRVLTGKQIDETNFVNFSGHKHTKELNFPPRPIPDNADPLTSLAQTCYNISSDTKHPQTDAAGYVALKDAEGMLTGEGNDATVHNIDNVYT
ncbi:uncharacterized protein [Haliotis asinina]|uniref:uncharacterized protein n=1 Tax=Haliotis asinina TaxID=109174 RepID=UPI00353182B6